MYANLSKVLLVPNKPSASDASSASNSSAGRLLLGPLRHAVLDMDTDLRVAPDNWLQSCPGGADSLEGFSATHHYTAFSSFKMASRHVDRIVALDDADAVDVVSDQENIKKLLKLPYSDASISLIIHRVGKTLLIDEFDFR